MSDMVIKDLLINDELKLILSGDGNNYDTTDLESIKSFTLNGENYPLCKLDDLVYFTKLENLILKNIVIDDYVLFNILSLKNLESLSLEKCNIKSNKLGELSIKKLYINGGMVDYLYYINDINNLENLYLDNLDKVDLKLLNMLSNLKEFSIGNSIVVNDEYIFYLNKVEKLRLDGTGINDLSLCLSLENLKVLIIDENQVLNNKDFIKKLKEKSVIVVDSYNREINV